MMLLVRSVARWGPFRDLLRMDDDMDHAFTSLWQIGGSDPLSVGGWVPTVEVYEDKKNVFVEAELPGVNKEDISLNLTGEVLTIQGERKDEQEKKDEHYILREATYGSFYRVVQLPHEVDHVKGTAEYKDGILKVTLPKAEKSKGRVIKIDVK